MMVVVTTDHETDEDCEHGSKVTKILIDSFLRRPSIEDKAIEAISDFANNGVFMMRNEKHEKFSCDTGTLLFHKGKARWFIAGGSAVYYFEDGNFKCRSLEEATAPLGTTPHYKARLEDSVTLGKGDNAFLVCSSKLTELVKPEELEADLKASTTAKEWMDKIVDRAGEDVQFCAAALLLPKRKTLFGR